MEIAEAHEIISSWQRYYHWVLNVLSQVLNSSKHWVLVSHSPLSGFKALFTILWINLIQSCSECK